MQSKDHVVHTFLVSTLQRDKTAYPNSSDFVYQLPQTLHNVEGVSIRDYKFKQETIVNENNKTWHIYIDDGRVDGNITLTTGDYSNDITMLLAEINSNLSVYDIQFVVDENSGNVGLTFIGSFVQNYVIIYSNSLLRSLGYFGGIALYQNSPPGGLPGTVRPYPVTAIAENPYDVWNSSNMVLRIQDVEAVSASDSITNRSTAILFSFNDAVSTYQRHDYYSPLLQPQSRLQSLRIKLLNMYGDYYDTVKYETAFLIRFYCRERSDR
jgi:hypothetical protein